MDPTVVPDSDAKLLAAFSERRDESAFAELVRRHGGMVLSVCRSVLGDISDAEEAAQAVFLTLAQKSGSVPVQDHLVGWLHRVAWYVAARAAQARATRRRHEQEAARMRTEIESSPSQTTDLEAIHAGLAKLPERYRVPLILHHLEGRSHQETATLTGCSVSAIAVRLHRGREMLRSRLSKRGGAVAATSLVAGAWGAPLTHMSAAFADQTTEAAVAVTGGSVASTAVVSSQTAALANQAMTMLFRAKLQSIAWMLLAVLLLGGVTVTMLSRATPLPAAAGSVVVPPAPPVPSPPTLPTLPVLTGSMEAVTGMITRVDNRSLDIQRRNNQTVSVELTDTTAVKVDDRPATIADLKYGMSAAAIRDAGKPASEILAYTALGAGPAK